MKSTVMSIEAEWDKRINMIESGAPPFCLRPHTSKDPAEKSNTSVVLLLAHGVVVLGKWKTERGRDSKKALSN